MSGTDITTAVTLIPRPPGTVRHLKLIMEEEREGGILEREKGREKNKNLGFRLVSGEMMLH